MKIDASIVESYLNNKPEHTYSNHIVYDLIEPGKNVFMAPDYSRIHEVRECYEKFSKAIEDFSFRNSDLIAEIFGDITSALAKTNIILTVGMPPIYDAMVRDYEDDLFVIFDLMNCVNYLSQGIDLSKMLNGLLTHELIHILIFESYPSEDDLDYIDYLNYITFHEGFAHLLSYVEDILLYQPDDKIYKERFKKAKVKLATALTELDPKLQQKYRLEANTGSYWDKFGSIASKLYLMKHMKELKSIYDDGWKKYVDKVINYNWD